MTINTVKAEQFNDEDINNIFIIDDTTPMELAALSSEEMNETKGATLIVAD